MEPLPNPLLRGEGKGITFNTGEALNWFFVLSKSSGFSRLEYNSRLDNDRI
jgi:hypothetical protein